MNTKNKTGAANFFVKVSAPAQRALAGKGTLTVQQLSNFSKAEILRLHGMGPGSIPKLEQALKEAGLSFKED